MVSRDGIQCNPDKVSAVEKWPRPQNLKELGSFSGLCSYYRMFIQDCSEIMAPLIHLTKRIVKFRWDEKCEVAFSKIKQALVQAPVAYPTSEDTFILDTDASAHSVGGEKIIAYASKTLRDGQTNYCATKRELLAVIIFVRHFLHYLWSYEVTYGVTYEVLY